MAAKHDSKQARANQWVTQQNLARQKSFVPRFQPKPRAPKMAKAVARVVEAAASAETTTVEGQPAIEAVAALPREPETGR